MWLKYYKSWQANASQPLKSNYANIRCFSVLWKCKFLGKCMQGIIYRECMLWVLINSQIFNDSDPTQNKKKEERVVEDERKEREKGGEGEERWERRVPQSMNSIKSTMKVTNHGTYRLHPWSYIWGKANIFYLHIIIEHPICISVTLQQFECPFTLKIFKLSQIKGRWLTNIQKNWSLSY